MGFDMYRNLTSNSKKTKKSQQTIYQNALVEPGPDLVTDFQLFVKFKIILELIEHQNSIQNSIQVLKLNNSLET